MKFTHRKQCIRSLWIAALGTSVAFLLTDVHIEVLLEAAAQSIAGNTGSAQIEVVQTESNELLTYAKNYAKSKGYRFGPGVDNMLQQRLANFSRTELKARINEAKRNIERFIKEMIVASNEIPDSKRNPWVLEKETFTKAEQRLCPIWPICR